MLTTKTSLPHWQKLGGATVRQVRHPFCPTTTSLLRGGWCGGAVQKAISQVGQK